MIIKKLMQRIGHGMGATLGLVRAEMRGGLRLTVGLMACAAAALLFGRFVLRIEAPVGGRAQENILLSLAFLYAIPALAGAFEVGRGQGAFRVLQAAPVLKLQVFAAKLLGPLMLTAIAVGVTAALDVGLALVAPAPKPGGLGDGLEWRGLTGMILGLGTLSVFGTLLAAIVTRHAFGACAVGGLLAAVPVTLSLSSEHTIFSDVLLTSMQSLTLGSGNLGIAASVVLTIIAVLFPLRGFAARNMLLRGALLGAGTVGLVAVPMGMRMVGTLMMSPATFDIAGGRVRDIDVSLDRSQIAVQIYHWDKASQNSSLWTIDAETYEVTALPNPVSGALALMRVDFTGANWSVDGTQVCGAIFPSSKLFGIDVNTGRVKELPWEEFDRKVNNAGWTFHRSLPNGGGVTRNCRAMHPQYGSVAVRSLGSPKAAERASHLFYYLGEDCHVHRVDASTGESTTTDLELPIRTSSFIVSPEGKWLLAHRGTGRRELYHVASGRSVAVEGAGFILTDRERPLMLQKNRLGNRDWFEVGLDKPVLFKPDCDACWLTELDGERWIARVDQGQLFVLDRQGKVLHRLRDAPEPEPRR